MISLVIPTFNEEKRLRASLELLVEFLKNFKFDTEIVIADDGSSDKTIEIAKSFEGRIKNFKIVGLGKNTGKGFAVNQGFFHSKGDIVIFTDADFSTPIKEVSKLVEPLMTGYDIAIGSRALDRSTVKRHQNIFREMMGRAFNILVRTLTVKGISDTQCGFKGFRREVSQTLFEKQTIWDFGFDVELLYLAQKQGLKIIEVPVLWFNDPRSSVNPIRDSVRAFFDLIKIRLVHYK